MLNWLQFSSLTIFWALCNTLLAATPSKGGAFLPHSWNLDWPYNWLWSIKQGGSNLMPALSWGLRKLCTLLLSIPKHTQASLLNHWPCGPGTSYCCIHAQATFRTRAVQLLITNISMSIAEITRISYRSPAHTTDSQKGDLTVWLFQDTKFGGT